ncbi:pentatricopeptide repeat-containing protein At2g22410, mitochondrial-like [Wolffia australiana]
MQSPLKQPRLYANLEQLRPHLARLLITGQICKSSVVRQLADYLTLFTDCTSTPHFSRLLSAHYSLHLPSSTTFFCNTLIRGWAKSAQPWQAMETFSHMLRLGSLPDNFTFPFLAMATSRTSIEEGLQTHAQVLARGLMTDVYALNTLLRMYSQHKDMGSTQKLFETSLSLLDVVSWNTIIDGYAKSGSLRSARQMFEEMPERNEISWSAMVSGYAGLGELDSALSLFHRMPKTIGKNVVTWNSMITGFAKKGLVSAARQFFDEMPARNVVSWNAMISGYALNGDMISARALFNKMPTRDVVSWSSMMSGYAQGGHYREALALFSEMQQDKSVRPNEVTMVSLLSSCAHLAALEQGKWAHQYIDKNKMKLDCEHNLGASLVDMYAKCGCADSAMEIFRSLNHKNVSSWNSIITGLAINGLAHEAIAMFEEMRQSGTKPNDVSFLGVLIACTHGGLVDEGQRYFTAMYNVYGIEPQIKHYGCLVDLLARAGMVEQAAEFIRSMPMKPDEMTLGALLGACRIHKKVHAAERLTAENHLELDSSGAGCLVLLSNVYASAGRWRDASEIRGLLMQRGVRKMAGCSSVDTNAGN